MKRWIVLLSLAALLALMLAPGASYTEDRDTVLLARAIYAMAGREAYGAKLAAGTVAMNRVESARFGDTLGEVLNEQHQFPFGRRYDGDSLAAAHEVLSGRRTLSADVLFFHPADAAEPWAIAPVRTVGSYSFYDRDGSL